MLPPPLPAAAPLLPCPPRAASPRPCTKSLWRGGWVDEWRERYGGVRWVEGKQETECGIQMGGWVGGINVGGGWVGGWVVRTLVLFQGYLAGLQRQLSFLCKRPAGPGCQPWGQGHHLNAGLLRPHPLAAPARGDQLVHVVHCDVGRPSRRRERAKRLDLCPGQLQRGVVKCTHDDATAYGGGGRAAAAAQVQQRPRPRRLIPRAAGQQGVGRSGEGRGKGMKEPHVGHRHHHHDHGHEVPPPRDPFPTRLRRWAAMGHGLDEAFLLPGPFARRELQPDVARGQSRTLTAFFFLVGMAGPCSCVPLHC